MQLVGFEPRPLFSMVNILAKSDPPGGVALIQGCPKKTRGKLVPCSPGYWREAPMCFIYLKKDCFCHLDWINCLSSVLYHKNNKRMQFHHYLKVNKLCEKFAQLEKNKGLIRIPIWGVGFYSGFWPEYTGWHGPLSPPEGGITMYLNKNLNQKC